MKALLLPAAFVGGLVAGGAVQFVASAEAASGGSLLGLPRLLVPTILTAALLLSGAWAIGRLSRDARARWRLAALALFSLAVVIGSGSWAIHVALLPAALLLPVGAVVAAVGGVGDRKRSTQSHV